MKKVDTFEYLTMLKELTEQGKEVNLIISGNSMSPFLANERDTIWFQKPTKPLKKGDMVFYQRPTGQYVMHRISKVTPLGYYIVGDAQQDIEGPVPETAIFAIITKVKRKNKIITKGNFWWEFFEHIWINLIPYRRCIMKCYSKLKTIIHH